MLCINSAILLPWVQQKYDLPKNEKYCVLGGKKSDATRKSWKLFSNPLTVRGWRGGEGCSLPVAHQSGRSTILNISGNSLDLFVNVLRVFWILTVHWGRRSAPHLWEGLDRPHCRNLGEFLGKSWGKVDIKNANAWRSSPFQNMALSDFFFFSLS